MHTRVPAARDPRHSTAVELRSWVQGEGALLCLAPLLAPGNLQPQRLRPTLLCGLHGCCCAPQPAMHGGAPLPPGVSEPKLAIAHCSCMLGLLPACARASTTLHTVGSCFAHPRDGDGHNTAGLDRVDPSPPPRPRRAVCCKLLIVACCHQDGHAPVSDHICLSPRAIQITSATTRPNPIVHRQNFKPFVHRREDDGRGRLVPAR